MPQRSPVKETQSILRVTVISLPIAGNKPKSLYTHMDKIVGNLRLMKEKLTMVTPESVKSNNK